MGAATDEAEEKADAVGLLHGYSRGGGEGGRRGRSWRMVRRPRQVPCPRPPAPVLGLHRPEACPCCRPSRLLRLHHASAALVVAAFFCFRRRPVAHAPSSAAASVLPQRVAAGRLRLRQRCRRARQRSGQHRRRGQGRPGAVSSGVWWRICTAQEAGRVDSGEGSGVQIWSRTGQPAAAAWLTLDGERGRARHAESLDGAPPLASFLSRSLGKQDGHLCWTPFPGRRRAMRADTVAPFRCGVPY